VSLLLVAVLMAPCGAVDNPEVFHCSIEHRDRAPFPGELYRDSYHEDTRRVMKGATVAIKDLEAQRDRLKESLNSCYDASGDALKNLAEACTQTVLGVEVQRDSWRRLAVKESNRVPLWRGLGILGVGAGALLPLEFCDGLCHDYRWHAAGALLTAGVTLVIGLAL